MWFADNNGHIAANLQLIKRKREREREREEKKRRNQ
jgi:hypothetical protein